jgi:hypothetical protein
MSAARGDPRDALPHLLAALPRFEEKCSSWTWCDRVGVNRSLASRPSRWSASPSMKALGEVLEAIRRP